MKKIYCVNWNKYRKFKNPKISFIFNESVVPSINCDKCSSNSDTKFKKEESIKILKILGLMHNISHQIQTFHVRLRYLAKEKIGQE